jgi:ATP/maltotriose-dependent transcriptional regulator MalT
VELGPAELSFSASECEELLRLRHGRAVTEDEVAAAVAATEGWPMGVALTSLTGAVAPARRDELFTYLAEEVLDRLEPATARALVDSSVPATLTPALADGLGLPPGFLADAERLGLFLRAHPSGDRSFHPLFRAFLLERLHHMHTEAERASIHARAAEHLAAAGRHEAAIEHWLDAGDSQRALEELAAHGPALVRISPAAVAGWLSRLPAELRRAPDSVFLDGQLLWLGGQHEQRAGPAARCGLGIRRGRPPRTGMARALRARRRPDLDRRVRADGRPGAGMGSGPSRAGADPGRDGRLVPGVRATRSTSVPTAS